MYLSNNAAVGSRERREVSDIEITGPVGVTGTRIVVFEELGRITFGLLFESITAGPVPFTPPVPLVLLDVALLFQSISSGLSTPLCPDPMALKRK